MVDWFHSLLHASLNIPSYPSNEVTRIITDLNTFLWGLSPSQSSQVKSLRRLRIHYTKMPIKAWKPCACKGQPLCVLHPCKRKTQGSGQSAICRISLRDKAHVILGVFACYASECMGRLAKAQGYMHVSTLSRILIRSQGLQKESESVNFGTSTCKQASIGKSVKGMIAE